MRSATVGQRRPCTPDTDLFGNIPKQMPVYRRCQHGILTHLLRDATPCDSAWPGSLHTPRPNRSAGIPTHTPNPATSASIPKHRTVPSRFRRWIPAHLGCDSTPDVPLLFRILRVRFLCVFLLLMLCTAAVQAVPGDVILQDAPADSLAQSVETRLAAVLGLLETGDLTPAREAFTANGLDAAAELLEQVRMRNTRAAHETRLLRLPGAGGYEVRDIRVQVEMGATPGSPYQSLVFTLTDDGRIDGLRFAMERRFYQDLARDGEQLRDFVQRQQIVQCVELFRTAYNRRDLKYIERIFSNDALIIVGRVLQERPDLPTQDGRLENSLLSRDRIEFIRRSKGEYLDALRQVFRRNDFLKVEFDSLRVVRDLQDSQLYGVTLKQRWTSSTYSDTGYVFLLLDFADPDYPLLHVRSWQPERFDDGSIISLQDFEIIRVEEP